jgi:hypothetical protein
MNWAEPSKIVDNRVDAMLLPAGTFEGVQPELATTELNAPFGLARSARR